MLELKTNNCFPLNHLLFYLNKENRFELYREIQELLAETGRFSCSLIGKKHFWELHEFTRKYYPEIKIPSDSFDIWLETAQEEGNTFAANARKVFVYRVAKYIGAYVAAMNGVDAIAFTAGVGENDHLVREEVCKYLGYLGITLDAEANKKRGQEIRISTPDSKVAVLIIPTNEELAIARETMALVQKGK